MELRRFAITPGAGERLNRGWHIGNREKEDREISFSAQR